MQGDGLPTLISPLMYESRLSGFRNYLMVNSRHSVRGLLHSLLMSEPLVGFGILEREPARPLVRPRLPRYPAIARSKQHAPTTNHKQATASYHTQGKRRDACLSPHGVAVEGICSMVGESDGQRGHRVRRLGIFRICCRGSS